MLTAINPANGKIIHTYEEHSAQEVEDKVKTVDQAFLTWRETTFPQRVEKLRNASKILINKKEEYAALMAAEMGKPIRDGRAEIEKCAWVCDYYADNALTALQPETIRTDARSYISFKPLGVILAIMPWNYPFWQVFRFAAPALMAGNAAVLKHASNVPGCSLAVEEIFKTAGFPENLFQNVLNSGQSCIAAKRFVVVEAVRERFEDMLVTQMGQKKMGSPLEEDTEIGPQARLDLRDELHRQVMQSIDGGARCLLGGRMPESDGTFYPATVLNNVQKGMPAYDEETFGPVAAVIVVKNEAEAIRTANDTAFGLGAAVFTADVDHGERIAAEKLEAGNCFVNAFVRSDPRLPFGRIKQSGYGRELSHYGIKEFVNIKTVYVG